MKKTFKIIVALILVILIAVGIIVVLNQDSGPDIPGPIIDSSGDNVAKMAKNIVVESSGFVIKTDNRYIDCTYPKITSLEDKEFENSINTEIALNIQGYRDEIEFIIDDETEPTEMYRYVTSYERYNNGKYLSLVIDQDYQTGGIRSNKWKDTYNINSETERLVYLSELFEPGVKYEETIISEITAQASAKNYELIEKGLTKLSTKQKFYIKDEKLVVYFDPAEIAATRFGELHFEMPFTMNENGFFEISNTNVEL